jgi:hypothetical protein
MHVHRLLLVSVVVLLASTYLGEAMDTASVVPAPHDPKAECLNLQRLCRDARAAKQEAQEAMAASRVFHEQAKAILAARIHDELRLELQREGQAVQMRLTATSSRRDAAAAAFTDAVYAVTVRRGVRPACASCPGITGGR